MRLLALVINSNSTVRNEFSINEVSAMLAVSTCTLKHWESITGLIIHRNSKNARRYTQENINQLKEIKDLMVNGKSLNEIKDLLNEVVSTDNHQQPKIEIIQEEKEDTNHNFEIFLRPLENRINELKGLNNELLYRNENLNQENKELIRDNATLTERVKNKDDIISFKDSMLNDKDLQIEELSIQKAEIEVKLNKPWWQFWK